MSDRHRTSMDPQLDDVGQPAPAPRDPSALDMFADDEQPPRKGPGDTEPTDSEGRESRTSDLGREESRR